MRKITSAIFKLNFLFRKLSFRLYFSLKYYFFIPVNFLDLTFFGRISTPLVASLSPIYINLDSRLDRRKHIERELSRIGFNSFSRFSAIRHKLGILGCTISHRDLIQNAIRNNLEFILIVEDDAKFVCSRRSLEKALEIFLKNSAADVLCLGNNVIDKRTRFDKRLNRTRNTQTTSCYLMKSVVFQDYLETLNHGIDLIERGFPEKGAIDIVWKSLQNQYVFVVPSGKMVIQMYSYSDITESHAQYLA